LVSLEFKPEQVVYNSSSVLPSNTQRNFLSGSGEGLSFNSVVLHFEGVIRVEGTLARSVILIEFVARINFISVSPRKHHLLFSTKDPPTIQRMPWPIGDEDNESVSPSSLSYDTWLVNDIDFGWLVDCDGNSISTT
jgi:hypothetical protein